MTHMGVMIVFCLSTVPVLAPVLQNSQAVPAPSRYEHARETWRPPSIGGGVNVAEPQLREADICEDCGQEIDDARIPLFSPGEDILVEACSCRVLIHADHPGDDCPVCSLFDADVLKVVHTHPTTTVERRATRTAAEEPGHVGGID